VGGQEGGWGGGGSFGARGPEFTRACQELFFDTSCAHGDVLALHMVSNIPAAAPHTIAVLSFFTAPAQMRMD